MSPAPGAEPTTSPAQAEPLRRTLLRSAAQFSFATVASQASGLLRAYYIGRALGPAVAGVWIGLQLVVSYGANAHLGAIFGMHRNVPLLLGRGDEAGARDAERSTLGFTLLAGLLCLAAVLAAALGALTPLEPLVDHRARELLARLRDPGLLPVSVGIALVLPTNLLRSYYLTLMRAHNRFREASVASLVGSAVGVAGIPLIRAYGLVGVVWGLLALVGAELLMLVRSAGVPRFGLSWPVLRRQFAYGLLTVAITLVSTLLGSIDRTVLLEHFTAEQRGLYYPAVLSATFFAGLASVPNAILFPRLSERFGRTGDPAELVGLVDGPLRVVAVGLSLVAGAAALAMPAVVARLLPRFVEGAAAAQLALLGVACSVAVGVVVNAFYALDRQWLFLGLSALGAAASYGVTEVGVRLWPSLEAVAVGTSIGYLLYAVPVVLVGWSIMEQPLAAGVRAVGRVLLPIAASAVAVWLILSITARLAAPASIAGAALGEAAFLVVFGPWAFVVGRRFVRPG